MRVLLLHNRYRAEGGEERAVTEIAALLRRRGHDTGLIERSSDSVGRGRAALALLRGGEHPEAVGEAVRAFGADVVHAHNLHPLLGARALAAARAAGARTILHLHNFRLYCAVGIAYRDGAPCHLCRGRNTLPGVRHRCRGSLSEAAVYAAGLARQQPALLEHADALAVLAERHGALLREHGLPSEKVQVVPNFVSEWAPASRADEGEYALVSGRLVPEKGFDTAIRAASAAGIPLVVAGSGPDEARLRELAAGAEVRFAGWVDATELARLRAGAGVVLVPSRWAEVCPYSVLDAIAAGVPVLASDRGGLPELVGPGAVLPAEDLDAWRTALEALWREPSGRRSRGEAALSAGRDRYGEERAYAALEKLYGWVP